MFELEKHIEELQEELQTVNDDYKEVRNELEEIRKENANLREQFLVEKIKRQSLESNKLKYTMLKELEENSGAIEDRTFLDRKRDQRTLDSGSLQSQLKEQQRNTKKQALAHKYAHRWLSIVRERRRKRDDI